MQICKECGIKISRATMFSDDGRKRFDKCLECRTKTKKSEENEVNFGEVLYKAMCNRK
jgi:hypothetical protein